MLRKVYSSAESTPNARRKDAVDLLPTRLLSSSSSSFDFQAEVEALSSLPTPRSSMDYGLRANAARDTREWTVAREVHRIVRLAFAKTSQPG